MKLIIVNFFFVVSFLSSDAFAFDFKFGDYQLVKGDEKVCEDGGLIAKDGTLFLGSRYIFIHYKDKEYKFQSDDFACEYTVINTFTAEKYSREMTQKCKNPAENGKRKFIFKSGKKKNLLISIEIDQLKYECELRPIK
jgi:hypothetical protein